MQLYYVKRATLRLGSFKTCISQNFFNLYSSGMVIFFWCCFIILIKEINWYFQQSPNLYFLLVYFFVSLKIVHKMQQIFSGNNTYRYKLDLISFFSVSKIPGGRIEILYICWSCFFHATIFSVYLSQYYSLQFLILL